MTKSMTDLRRSIYGVAIVVAVTLAAQLVGQARRESPTPQKAVEMGARFTLIEGSVQFKRAATFQWIDATLAITLHDGDLVRTGKKATARVRMADGTRFTIRADSLILISIPKLDTEGHHPRPPRVLAMAVIVLAALVAGLALFRLGSRIAAAQLRSKPTRLEIEDMVRNHYVREENCFMITARGGVGMLNTAEFARWLHGTTGISLSVEEIDKIKGAPTQDTARS